MIFVVISTGVVRGWEEGDEGVECLFFSPMFLFLMVRLGGW